MESSRTPDIEMGRIDHHQDSNNTDGKGHISEALLAQSAPSFPPDSDTHGSSGSGNETPQLDLDESIPWILHAKGQSLIEKIPPGWTWSSSERRFQKGKENYRINLAKLQDLHLQELQYKLIAHAKRMQFREDEKGDWRGDLQQYVQAVQNRQLMKRGMLLGDPFLITPDRKISRIGLDAAMAGVDSSHMEEDARDLDNLGINRFMVAMIGGVFLTLPMWILSFVSFDREMTLWWSTAFVVGFGLTMAYLLDRYMDMISCTVAYAAVLVVFVGLNETS